MCVCVSETVGVVVFETPAEAVASTELLRYRYVLCRLQCPRLPGCTEFSCCSRLITTTGKVRLKVSSQRCRQSGDMWEISTSTLPELILISATSTICVLTRNNQLEQLEAVKAANLQLPLATYPYLWLPFLTFSFLSLTVISFPYLSLLTN